MLFFYLYVFLIDYFWQNLQIYLSLINKFIKIFLVMNLIVYTVNQSTCKDSQSIVNLNNPLEVLNFLFFFNFFFLIVGEARKQNKQRCLNKQQKIAKHHLSNHGQWWSHVVRFGRTKCLIGKSNPIIT